jgi:membrane associated rhomboid family serine protease
MLPISDDNTQRRTTPFINYGLIALNVLVFLYQLMLDQQGQLNDFINRYAVIPANITSGHDYLTLLTSQFLHGGWLHLGGNMLYLWIFGDNVEDALGHIPYLIFYLACGVIAALAQVLVDPGSNVPSLGASGAIAGVLGAYLVLFPHARVNTLIFLGIFFFFTRLTAILVIGFWIVLQFFSGWAEITQRTAQTGDGGVAYWAHIGGFIAGFVVGFIAKLFVQPRQPTYPGGYGPWGGYGRN